MPDSAAATLRAAIYARVSTEEQREGQTIDSQVAELERYAREKGRRVVGVYKDEGWSGSLLARPQLDRLRDDAARGLFDAVLINDVDRLARDVAHLGIVKRDLERRGVQIIFRKLPVEQSPTSNLMINILGSFAEFEREMIADRTRRGKRYKVEVRGQFLGSQPVYGYRYTPKDRAAGNEGRLEVVPEEATVVHQMYRWVAEEGLSGNKVVALLNELGARPRKGGRWSKSTVLGILRDEMYAGVWYYNKYYSCEPLNPVAKEVYKRVPKSSRRQRPRSEWLPVILPAELRIVERDVWRRTQEQLDRNVTFSPRNVKHFYLLRGLVKCGGCGAPYVGQPCHGWFYYRCFARCKRLLSVRDHVLDEVVWSAVEEALLKPELLLDQVEKHQLRVQRQASHLRTEIREIEAGLEGVRREEARIIEAYRKEVLSPAQLGEELEKIKARTAALEARKGKIAEEGSPAEDADVRRSAVDYCLKVAVRLKALTAEERQHFLRLLIDQVVFEGERVRIKGIIPLLQEEKASTDNGNERGESVILESIEENVTATSRRCGRNVSTRNPGDLPSNKPKVPARLRFEITRAMPEKRFSVLSTEGLALIRRLAARRHDPTLKELCEQVHLERGAQVSVYQMSRALRRLGLSPTRRGPRTQRLSGAA
jgi:site-specific DNA recombinase